MRDRNKYLHKVITLLDILKLTLTNVTFKISDSHISAPKYFGFHVQHIELKTLHSLSLIQGRYIIVLTANLLDTIRHLDYNIWRIKTNHTTLENINGIMCQHFLLAKPHVGWDTTIV